MAINSPKEPEPSDSQGDVDIKKLLDCIKDRRLRYDRGFTDIEAPGNITEDDAHALTEILHLKPDADVETIGKTIRWAIAQFGRLKK